MAVEVLEQLYEGKAKKVFKTSDDALYMVEYKDDATAGISKEFRTTKKVFEGLLRSLNSDMNRVIIAELNMGLDNITLRDDLNPLTALKAVMSL